MTDLRDSIEMWTHRLVELAGGSLDEDEARALVRDIHDAAAETHRNSMAQLEAEREE